MQGKRFNHPSAFWPKSTHTVKPLDPDMLAKVGRGEAAIGDVLALGAKEVDQIWECTKALLLSARYERTLEALGLLTGLGYVSADLCMARAACYHGLKRRQEAEDEYALALTLTPPHLRDELRRLGLTLGLGANND